MLEEMMDASTKDLRREQRARSQMMPQVFTPEHLPSLSCSLVARKRCLVDITTKESRREDRQLMRLLKLPRRQLPPEAGLTFPERHPQRRGVPRSQKIAPSLDLAVGLCLGLYGGPRGWAFSHERGTPER